MLAVSGRPALHPLHTTLKTHVLDFWLARGAIALTAGLNLLLVNDLALGPSWLAPAFEFAMLIPLSIATAWTQGRVRHAHTDHHWKIITRSRRVVRWMALVLTAIVTAINFYALYRVMGALLHGAKGSTGETLLLDALNIWFTNIVVFALWFWNLDRGGPAMRGLAVGKEPDFQFPQMQGVDPAACAWAPGFVDYFYLAFTNATAFSPTDTLPMTGRAKLLMMLESSVSLLTVGLVAARAVNILA
ncbi:MAG: hypothetical protein V4505_26780 [Pseudomonadota bacterium]